MIIYEVNVAVDDAVADAYAAWLRGHIEEMLAFEGFEGADWYEQEPDEAGRRQWTVHYRVRDRGSLQDYLDRHAEHMRSEGLRRFGERLTADRRVLVQRAAFGG